MGQANSRQEAFWDACGFGRTHLVKKFIDEGIDINWVSFTHDCCPIHVASQGKPDVVKLLIEAKCDVNVQDSRGMTALHHAAMKGELDILSMLVDAGSELNTQDKNGWTALHNAAYWAYQGVVEKLINVGASVSMVNKHQRLALHEVARSQSMEEPALGQIAGLLISAGSDVNATSSDFGEADFTSLMFAAYHGHAEVVSALVDADCNLNANGSINKWTALHWAADRGHSEVVTLLVEAGADVSKKNMRGETAADRAKEDKTQDYLLNCLNDQDRYAADRTSISSSQSFNAQTALDTAVAIEKITAQAKSSAAANAYVPITMPPLAIATSEERKRNIKMGLNKRTSGGGSASGPTSPGWSPGSAPHVELATDSLGDSMDPNIQLLRSFQDRLNRRINEASRSVVLGGLLGPEGADSTQESSSSSSSEMSTREQTPASTSVGGGGGAARDATPSQGSESMGTSSCESEEGLGGGGGGEKLHRRKENGWNSGVVGEDGSGVGDTDQPSSVDRLSATADALHISQHAAEADGGDSCASENTGNSRTVAQSDEATGKVTAAAAKPEKAEANV